MDKVKERLELAQNLYQDIVQKCGDDVGVAYQVGVEILSSVGASIIAEGDEKVEDFINELNKALEEAIKYKVDYINQHKNKE